MKELRAYQSLPVGMLLCAVGGGLDADSFLLHGHVFAGLQTGNLVLLGAGYSQLTMIQIIKYVVAITAFVMGLLVTCYAQDRYRATAHYFSFSAVMILTEIGLLLMVSLFSTFIGDLVTLGILSFIGAIQLQTFQFVDGNSFTPLMMMGHMKKLINFIDRGNRDRVLANLWSLVSFFIGAVITGLLTVKLSDWALSFAVTMLVIILLIATKGDKSSKIIR